MKILRRNAVGITMFPVWSYLSYFTFKIKSDLDPYKDSEVLEKKGRGWLLENIERSSRGVGVGFFLFGKQLSGSLITQFIYIMYREGNKILGPMSKYRNETVSLSYCCRSRFINLLAVKKLEHSQASSSQKGWKIRHHCNVWNFRIYVKTYD